MVAKDNEESPNVSKRQKEIDERWENLRKNFSIRMRALEDAEKFHKYKRECDEVSISFFFSFLFRKGNNEKKKK